MAAEFPWQLRSTPGATDIPDAEADLGDVSSPVVPGAEATVPDATAADPDAEVTVPDAESALPDAEEYRSLLAAAAQVLDRVDRALGELADGSYGRCKECGAVIADAVLETDPTAQRCAEHAAGRDPAG
jgi:RNA polymerase-binding transcription factor DksA